MNSQIQKIIKAEEQRQQNTLDLIPSENFSSKAVRSAVGSVLMHKYSEGYPGARYYEGNEQIDEIENLCRKQVLKVMLANDSDDIKNNWHANVQVLSGSVANLAVYNAVLKPGDKIMGMYLPDGGHLSHGWSYTPTDKRDGKDDGMAYYGGSSKLTLNSKIFKVVQYKTDPKTHLFDYDFIEELAVKEKPKMIITGGTAYPRGIDYKRIREIANKIGAMYLADIAHEAGLVAAGAVESPFKYADFVTFTTHKTFRGPKGAVALCKKEYAKKLDRSVIPGLLGGPFNHNIAGIAQAAFEIDTPEFQEYAKKVVKNAKTMANELIKYGFDVVSGGTDKHLVLVNLTNKNISGKYFAKALAKAGIIANMNTVPYETGSPSNPSGIRFGTPTITTRGFKEDNVNELVKLINEVYEIVKNKSSDEFDDYTNFLDSNNELASINKQVLQICKNFPLHI